MPSCAFGQCDRSRALGGPGCDLCDRVMSLPQPKFRSGDELEMQTSGDTKRKGRRRAEE